MKICIVTGANTGIGLAIAESLAEQGQGVVMVCRDEARGLAALERVRARAAAGATVELVRGDLGTIASSERAAKAIADACPRIDVLIHNAGLWPTERHLNEEGFERAFAVNHLAPFVLGQRLLPVLRRTEGARIVQVTAGLYVKGSVDLERTPTGEDFGMMRTYASTKLWNLLATLELSRREADEGPCVLAVHPGVVRTGLGEHGHWAVPLVRLVKRLWITPEQGARGPVRAALDPSLDDQTGTYYDQLERAKLTAVATDRALAQQVWAHTEALVAAARRGEADGGAGPR